jgi:hypothetical protein
MSTGKKTTNKVPAKKDSISGSMHEEEPNSRGEVYDNTMRLLEKGGDPLKSSDVFHNFKK